MSRNLIIGGLLTALVVLAALLSFVWTPYAHTAMDIPNKLQPPNGTHWLGTDHFGRDILSLIMVGAPTSSAGAINAIIAIGIFNIPVFARVTRGGALPILAREFIMAARVSGKGDARIAFEHVLGNVANLLIVQATIQFSLGILAEAALSYVGLGAQPPTPSWGRMLADAQTLVSIAPHMALIPGCAIIITVLGLNLLGDGLRDRLDPKLRVSRV